MWFFAQRAVKQCNCVQLSNPYLKLAKKLFRARRHSFKSQTTPVFHVAALSNAVFIKFLIFHWDLSSY